MSTLKKHDPLDERGRGARSALRDRILSMSPSEGAQWVEDNVTDLQSAKAILKTLVTVNIALAHEVKRLR